MVLVDRKTVSESQALPLPPGAAIGSDSQNSSGPPLPVAGVRHPEGAFGVKHGIVRVRQPSAVAIDRAIRSDPLDTAVPDVTRIYRAFAVERQPEHEPARDNGDQLVCAVVQPPTVELPGLPARVKRLLRRRPAHALRMIEIIQHGP